MHVVLLCATERGLRFLERLYQLLEPSDRLTVCSFRETAWEPPYLERIQARAQQIGASFYETRNVTELNWTLAVRYGLHGELAIPRPTLLL
ncbi:MAG UNVERIFIED_CONTAM: hypothetical protein LVT10_20015 [Anaerolineae bacterium]|jgi:hypothetical protein